MLRVSDIVENNKLFDSVAFNSLTPVMQTAVKEIFSTIEKDKEINAENLPMKFEDALDNVATLNEIEKEALEQYFDDEISEYLDKMGDQE
jgi:NTP pyrophosphatase (non-canonical NTP hydrolase)|tara:strand:+ start:261 stop:530 length:270 start_codon:yes stop_codon:yes gene_type:complete